MGWLLLPVFPPPPPFWQPHPTISLILPPFPSTSFLCLLNILIYLAFINKSNIKARERFIHFSFVNNINRSKYIFGKQQYNIKCFSSWYFSKNLFTYVDFIYNFYAQFNIFICIQCFGYITNNKKSRTTILYFPNMSHLQNY